MTDKEKLMQILNVPIFPHVDADPLEAVADYLLDNDVRPVVRCKNCIYAEKHDGRRYVKGTILCTCPDIMRDGEPAAMWETDFCAYGDSNG